MHDPIRFAATRTAGASMTFPTSTVVTWRYVRWKALFFVTLAALARRICLRLALGEPVWRQPEVNFGPRGEDFAYAWIVRPILLLAEAGFLVSGAWSAIAVCTRAPIVTATPDWIEARTSLGGRRRLIWSVITDAAAYESEIILSPGEAGAKAQARLALPHNDAAVNWEWLKYRAFGTGLTSWRAVVINVGVLDVAPGEVRNVIARHRPDLVIRPVRWI